MHPVCHAPPSPVCRLCSLPVLKGQVLIIAVTGTESNDFGAFKLTLDFEKAGSSMATANYLGSDASVVLSGDSMGYNQSMIAACNTASDGPDVVSGLPYESCSLPILLPR